MANGTFTCHPCGRGRRVRFYDGEDVSNRPPAVILKTDLIKAPPSLVKVADSLAAAKRSGWTSGESPYGQRSCFRTAAVACDLLST